nr:Heme/hemopexin-binding protein [Candidatus Anoxychlamydiales bacterium]
MHFYTHACARTLFARILVYILLACFILPISIFSLPQKEKVVFGSISIEESLNEIKITQKCSKAIIDWKDFSLKKDEIASFIQDKDYSVLNRVVTDKISKIYGSIHADGNFYLINQNGILIGPKGSISAKEVMLSTLELSNEDYLKNKDLSFSSSKDGKIQNFGSIKALSKDVFILSKTIENKAKISAKKGEVNLIASSKILILDGKKDIIIKPEIDGSISNEGNIKAIEVKLKSSNNNLNTFAINQKGLIEATGFEKKDGKVILIAERGITKHTGTTVAKNENETGGKVRVLAEHVVIDSESKIDTSASFGGGEVLIGGDFQGKNPDIKNARTVFVAKDALINADASQKGNGGKVILWANDTNSFYGNVTAKGGKKYGDGGFVEIS